MHINKQNGNGCIELFLSLTQIFSTQQNHKETPKNKFHKLRTNSTCFQVLKEAVKYPTASHNMRQPVYDVRPHVLLSISSLILKHAAT